MMTKNIFKYSRTNRKLRWGLVLLILVFILSVVSLRFTAREAFEY